MGAADDIMNFFIGGKRKDEPSAGTIGGSSDRYDNLASLCESGNEKACQDLKKLYPNGRPENSKKPDSSPATSELKRR